MIGNHEADSSDISVQSYVQNHISDNMDGEELASIPHKYDYYFMPNKSQVLFYLSDALLLRIRRTGTELQVTDSIDFPLFDIWEEVSCDKSTMILESYGRTVLLISKSSATGCMLGNKSEPPLIAINDWNGDLFGFFVPGDPFLIEDSNKRTVAKILAAENTYGRVTVWICILEGSGQEMARMEDYSTIYFTKNVGGFQLKLLALAAFARLTISEFVQSQSCCGSFFSMLFRC
ncbi:UvrABC system protein [Dirofilaria immitis]